MTNSYKVWTKSIGINCWFEAVSSSNLIIQFHFGWCEVWQKRHCGNDSGELALCSTPQFEGILPKGTYQPCVSMANKAFLAGYDRIPNRIKHFIIFEVIMLNWQQSNGILLYWHVELWRYFPHAYKHYPSMLLSIQYTAKQSDFLCFH